MASKTSKGGDMNLRDNLRAGRRPKLEARETFKARWRDKVQAALEAMPDIDERNAADHVGDIARAVGIQDDEVGNPAMIAVLVLQIILEILKARNAK